MDVLVAPQDIGRAVGALTATGSRRDHEFCPPTDSPLFPPILRSQMELVLWHRSRQVDLHWRLDVARSGLSWQFEELVEAAEWVPVGSTTIPTLNRQHAAIFNAAHGARDAWSQLRGLVDQVRLVQDLDEAALRAEAWRVGAGRRMEVAVTMGGLLLGRTTSPVPRPARVGADRMWSWIQEGKEPKGRLGTQASARMLAVNVAMQDSPRAAAQRASTLIWPVREMARRSLGNAGDRHPWLYAAATPIFLPKRAMTKVRSDRGVRLAGLCSAQRPSTRAVRATAGRTRTCAVQRSRG